MTGPDDLTTLIRKVGSIVDRTPQDDEVDQWERDIRAIAARVEAEVARLTDEYESQREYADEQYRIARAAEAEVARFRAMEPFAKLYADSQAEVARLKTDNECLVIERDAADERVARLEAIRLPYTLREAWAREEELRAEIARLEQENTQLLSNIKDEAVQTILSKEYGSEQFRRAEAAEAEVARLRDGLRAAKWAINLGVGCARDLGDDKRLAALLEAEAAARALLADDGAAQKPPPPPEPRVKLPPGTMA